MNNNDSGKPRFDGVYISDVEKTQQKGFFKKRTEYLRVYTQFFEDGTVSTIAMLSENPNRPRSTRKLEKDDPKPWAIKDGEIEIPLEQGGFVYYKITSDGNLQHPDSGDVNTFVPHS